MAEPLLSLEEVCKQLQLSQEQVLELVKQGAVRGFLDQKVYKFRTADIVTYKQQVEDGGTVLLDGDADSDLLSPKEVTEIQAPAPGEETHETGKIDLGEVASEAGADESDQTSVLAPIEDAVGGEKEEEPEFEFADDDLGLALDDDAVDSVLVADESESSVDILDTVDETSSESATSATDLDLADESSGEDVAVISDDAIIGEPIALETIDLEPGSDTDLETIDLDEIAEKDETVVEDLMGETVEVAELTEDEGPPTETVDTFPIEELAEPETVGIAAEEDATTIGEPDLDAAVAVEEDVEGLEFGEPREAEEEEAFVEEEPVIAGGWDLVVPWMPGNILLVAAIVVLLAGGAFLLFEMSDIGDNTQFTRQFIDFVIEKLPNK